MSGRGWPRAYAPLRARTLLWQLAVLVAVEVALYTSYGAHAARFHWATHFLVGLTVASVWRAVFLLVAARPTRFQLLSVVGFHLWAMWPDLVFRTPGIPHERWMDWVALGHISSHYVPGGDTTWLLVALAAAGAYSVLLWRWLRARRLEAEAGMPPGLAIGGAAVLRPQRDPATTVLAHEQVGSPAEEDEPLLLLHGLGATSSTWLPTAHRLGEAGRVALVPDLLGFGGSMRLGTTFHLDAQAGAVERLLDHHGVRRVHVVAHSWGSTVAAALVRRAPDRVARMTLVAPAVFADVDTARERFSQRSVLAKATLAGSPLGGFVCGAMCLLRPLFGRLAPRLEPDVPREVARDGVQHSFAAYRDALTSMWEDDRLAEVLRRPPCPVTVVLGDDDRTVLPGDVLALPPDPSVRVVRVAGDHGIAYSQPELIAGLLLDEQAAAAATPEEST